jgi:hypothetical protein
MNIGECAATVADAMGSVTITAMVDRVSTEKVMTASERLQ